MKPTGLETMILNSLKGNWPKGASSMLYPMMAKNGNHTVNLEISTDDLLDLIRKKAKIANKND